jgi:hypothetical protein
VCEEVREKDGGSEECVNKKGRECVTEAWDGLQASMIF